jgi:hypothetical protein
MSLSKSTIKKEVADAFKAVMDDDKISRTAAIDKVADKIADAVMNAIKSMKINYTSGLATPSGGGAVTGVFTYTIS